MWACPMAQSLLVVEWWRLLCCGVGLGLANGCRGPTAGSMIPPINARTHTTENEDYSLQFPFDSFAFVDMFHTQELMIQTLDDDEIEGPEEFLLRLTLDPFTTFGDFEVVRIQTTVIIQDDEQPIGGEFINSTRALIQCLL